MPPERRKEQSKVERLSWFARAKPAKPAQGGRPGDLVDGWHSRGYLPHLKAKDAAYFVTIRLADSIPKEVVIALKAEAEQQLRSTPTTAKQETSSSVEREAHRDYFRKLEKWLDAGHGACWLRVAEVANLVASAFAHFRNERYVLHAWVIMPNHAHVVVQPLPGHTLSRVLHSWKSYTSKEAGKLIAGKNDGTFWQHESYNHWCRDDEERGRCITYVEANPVTAGFCSNPMDWQWSSARERAQ